MLLVVADHAHSVSLADLLRAANYKVTTASNFEAAKQQLAATPPAVLISDIRLGAFNGLHLVVLSQSKAVRSVVMDTVLDVTLEIQATRLGATYLVKPIEPTVLLRMVRAHL